MKPYIHKKIISKLSYIPTKNILLTCLLILNDFFSLKRLQYNKVFDNTYHIDKAIKWLCKAQNINTGKGVSAGFHLLYGWLPAYPETTGYIIETFFEWSNISNNPEFRNRAINMAYWLLEIQNEDGSITDMYFKNKMVFDTSQVIFGLIKAFYETKEERFLQAALKAGKWLISVQEKNGSWIKYALNNIAHTYYSRVAWSLVCLYQATKKLDFLKASLKNIEWTLSNQRENGWFERASFNLNTKPYTHTIAYTLRGILEVGILTKNEKFIRCVCKSIDKIVEDINDRGFVCGAYDMNWIGDKRFSCLTGSAQISLILFRLYTITHNKKYLLTAKNINKFLKKTQQLRLKHAEIYGAIAGSFPVWGDYLHFTYPNWAAKFFIDSLILEELIKNDK